MSIAFEEEENNGVSFGEQFVIRTSNMVYHTWKILNIIFSFTSSFDFAFIAAFGHLDEGHRGFDIRVIFY